MMPKVSVTVAIYNSEKYLRECVESLVNQTLSDIEIILVSDASPDNSILIMKEYKNKYPDLIQIYESPENRHAGGARNIGLDLSRGEYYAYIDADDYVEPTMYERLYDTAVRENADLVSCKYISFDDQTKKQRKWDKSGEFSRIVRKDILVSHSVRNPEHIAYIGNYFWPLVEKYVNKDILIDEYLYYYRLVDQSVSHTVNQNTINDRLTIEEMLVSEMVKRGLEEAPFSDAFVYERVYRYCVSTYCMFSMATAFNSKMISLFVDRCHFFLNSYFSTCMARECVKKRFKWSEKMLLWSFLRSPKLAWMLTAFCVLVLKPIRIAKHAFADKSK